MGATYSFSNELTVGVYRINRIIPKPQNPD
jgi:hypothetical protein